MPYIVSHLSVWLNICLISTFCSSEQEGEGYKSRAWQESRFSLNSNNTLKCNKVNSEMFGEIRSEPLLPVCIPCTARRDYFYLEDSGWYHFSKWESASAAWVIHLGSSDNFLWNMCVLFIPEEIPQHTSGDEYLWKGNKPSEHFAIKGILWKRVHDAHRAARADKLPRLAVQLPAQSHHVPLAGIRCSQSGCFIKTPSYKKCTLIHNIYSERIHLHQCPQTLQCCVCVCIKYV